jgi:hypothetical protein
MSFYAARMGPSGALAQVRLGRILVVGAGVALLLLLGVPKDIFGTRTLPPLWMVLLLGFAVVYAVCFVLFAERMVKPLADGLDAASARARGVAVLRSFIFLRAAVAVTPALLGLGVAAIGHSTTMPFLVTMPVSLVLLAVVYPRPATVVAVRDRLEAAGTASYLVVTDAVTE